jgi:hypothetical protein
VPEAPGKQALDELNQARKPANLWWPAVSPALVFTAGGRPAQGFPITFVDERMIPETLSPTPKPSFGGVDRALMPRYFAGPEGAMLLRTRHSD